VQNFPSSAPHGGSFAIRSDYNKQAGNEQRCLLGSFFPLRRLNLVRRRIFGALGESLPGRIRWAGIDVNGVEQPRYTLFTLAEEDIGEAE
jgi:hypothetical protein